MTARWPPMIGQQWSILVIFCWESQANSRSPKRELSWPPPPIQDWQIGEMKNWFRVINQAQIKMVGIVFFVLIASGNNLFNACAFLIWVLFMALFSLFSKWFINFQELTIQVQNFYKNLCMATMISICQEIRKPFLASFSNQFSSKKKWILPMKKQLRNDKNIEFCITI